MKVTVGQIQQLMSDFNEIGLAEFRRIIGEMTDSPNHEIDSYLFTNLLDFNGNRSMRAALASVLANREDETMIEGFGKVIEKETDVSLCKECILGLEKIGTPEAIQKLQFLARSKPNPTIATILRSEIEKLSKSEPVHYYLDKLKMGNQNPRACRNASRVLCRIATQSDVEKIMELFPDLDEMAQVEAMRVVTQHAKADYLDTIHELVEENLQGLKIRENFLDAMAVDLEEDKSTRVHRFLTEARNRVPEDKLQDFNQFQDLVLDNPASAESTLERLKTGDYTEGFDYFAESIYFIQRNQMAHARKIHELATKLTHARITRFAQFLAESSLALGRATKEIGDQEEMRLRSVELASRLLKIHRGDVLKNTLFALGHFLQPKDQELTKKLVSINNVEGMSRLLERLRQTENPDFMDFLLDVAQNHEFIEVQDKALKSLCVLEGIEPRIQEMLTDESPSILQMGIRLAGETTNAKFIEPLTPLLDHRSNIVRAETVKALGRIGKPECLGLIQHAMKESKSTALTHTCLEAISQLDTPEALQTLKEFAQNSRSPESSLIAVNLILGYFNHWKNPLPEDLCNLILPMLKGWMESNNRDFRQEAYSLGPRIYIWKIEVYQQLRDMYKEAISTLRKQPNWDKEEMGLAENQLKKLNALYFLVKDFKEYEKTLRFKIQQPIKDQSDARTLAYERLTSHLTSQDFPIEPSLEKDLITFVIEQLAVPNKTWRQEEMIYRVAQYCQNETLANELKKQVKTVSVQAKNSLLDALIKNGVSLSAFNPPEKIQSVMILEGSSFFAKRLQRELRQAGFKSDVACDLQQASNLFENQQYDAVLSELQLKEKGDAISFISKMSDASERPFHIIFSTNIRDGQLLEQAKTMNPKHILFKPYPFEQVVKSLM